MGNVVNCKTARLGEYDQIIDVRTHVLLADASESGGGYDRAPSAHDYFDAALAACKSMTATWFAKKNGMALERVESHVERDDSEERAGKYVLRVRLAFHGPLSDEDKKRLYAAVARCPVHKLMTSSDVVIETAPLDAP